MSTIMAVVLNGMAQLEFHRQHALPEQQSRYLDKMDEKMAKGITLADSTIKNPDLGQRAQFVAANLLNAILQNQESLAASLCSYLAMRLPDLQQVKFSEQENGRYLIDLVFDEEYRKEVPVQFTH